MAQTTWTPGPAEWHGFTASTGGDAVPGGYNGYVCLVDRPTGAEIGYLDWQTAAGRDELLVAMVGVTASFRRRGLATAMLDYVLRYQFDRAMTVSWGATTPDGEALRRAWKDPGHYSS